MYSHDYSSFFSSEKTLFIDLQAKICLCEYKSFNMGEHDGEIMKNIVFEMGIFMFQVSKWGFMELMEFNEASLSRSWACLTLVQRRTGSLSTGRRALWPMPKSKVLSLSRDFCDVKSYILVGRYSVLEEHVISIFRGEDPWRCNNKLLQDVSTYLQTSQIVTSVLTAL